MKVLLLFFGLSIGLMAPLIFTSNPLSIVNIISYFAFSILILILSIRQKQILSFLSGVVIGLIIAFLFIPPFISSFTNENGIVIKSSDNYIIFFYKFRKYYVYSKDNSYQFGDIIKVSGKSQEYIGTTYESQFDVTRYFKLNGVEYEISNAKIENVFLFPIRIVEYEKKFLSNFSNNGKSLVSSLLFNRKDYDSDIISSASKLGVINILGSCGIIARFFISFIKRFLFKLSDKWLDIIEIILLFFIIILSPYKIGLWRMFLVDIGKIINKKLLKNRFSYLEIVCFVGILLLLVDRYNIYQVGFVLGFTISLFNIFTNKSLYSSNKIKAKLYKLFLLQAILFPISLSLNYGKFSPLSFLFIQVLIPVIGVFMIIALFSIISFPFTHILNFFGDVINDTLNVFSKVNTSVYFSYFSSIFILCYFIVLIFILYLVEVRLKRIKNIAIIATISVILVSLLPVENIFIGQVSFINVGQGDSILIRDRFQTVLIDTGGNKSFDMAEETLIPFLRRNKIYKIDCLITSHGDFDHSGAANSLISKFKVNRYLDNVSSFPITVGRLKFTNYNIYGGSDENDKSSVLGLSFLGKRWIFTGDAGIEIEKKIIKDNPNLRCDILKVGHHGSNTSTSEEFLDLLKPKEAIISCGAKNSYGHPSKEVIKKLEERNIRIRRTSVEGTITYKGFS